MRAYIVLLFLIVEILQSCLTAGTHGSIKEYNFSVSDSALHRAVDKAILEYPDVTRDSIENHIIDATRLRNDTILDNRYNDGEHYVTIFINRTGAINQTVKYIFQYSGTNDDDSENSSSISIAYAFDDKGHGGSGQNGNWSKGMKKELIDIFEGKFINRIDSILISSKERN